MPEETAMLSSTRLMNLIQSGDEQEVETTAPALDSFLANEESMHQTAPPPDETRTDQNVSDQDVDERRPPLKSNFSLIDRWLSKTTVGLEITERAVRIAGIRSRGQRYEVDSAEEILLGDISDDTLLAVLRDLNRKYALSRKRTIPIFGGRDVNIRLLKMPRVSRREIHDALAWKNKKELHFFNDEPTSLHYVMVDDASSAQECLVLVVAVREDPLRRQADLFARAGIEPCSMIVRPHAKAALIQRLPGLETPCAMVDIGFESTEVTFFDGGKLHYTREILLGGKHFTSALMQTAFYEGNSCTLSLIEAEELKRESGMTVTNGNRTISGVPVSELTVLIRPVAEKLVNEVNLSLDYYSQHFKSAEVRQIYLTGGGSLMPGLADFFMDSMATPVRTFAASDHISSAEMDTIPLDNCFNAVGSALSAGSKFNILPKSHVRNHRIRRMASWVWTSGLLVTALLATAIALLSVSVRTGEERLVIAHMSLAAMEKQQAHFDKLQKDNTSTKNKIGQLQRDMQRDSAVVRLLKLISHSTPEAVLLTELVWGNGYNIIEIDRLRTMKITGNVQEETRYRQVKISGTVYKDLFYADLHLMDFVSALERTGAFTSAILKSRERNPVTERLDFELVLQTQDAP